MKFYRIVLIYSLVLNYNFYSKMEVWLYVLFLLEFYYYIIKLFFYFYMFKRYMYIYFLLEKDLNFK